VAPLSEHEQKILDEIERNLKDEPGSSGSRDLRSPDEHARRFRVGAFGFAAGFGLLIAFFLTQQLVVGVFAFGAMVVGIVVMAGAAGGYVAARNASRPSSRDRVARSLKGWEESLRRRYRKE
jgi:hypothetical protein